MFRLLNVPLPVRTLSTTFEPPCFFKRRASTLALIVKRSEIKRKGAYMRPGSVLERARGKVGEEVLAGIDLPKSSGESSEGNETKLTEGF